MNLSHIEAIVRFYHQPPAFLFPPTVNGRIPSAAFISDRQAQLDHLVHALGCLPLQHHIPGISLWLRIDPLDGGGFGFELDLDIVWDFVRHTARTRDNLVQARVENDERFGKWVGERMHLVPREELKLLGLRMKADEAEEAAARNRGKRRRSERTRTCVGGHAV